MSAGQYLTTLVVAWVICALVAFFVIDRRVRTSMAREPEPASQEPKAQQPAVLTREDVHKVLRDISYGDYLFMVGGTDSLWIKAMFLARCSVTGAMQQQDTRKWYLSRHACTNEIVQTALKCVLTSVEHEARERFKFRGRAIFGPHFDVHALHRICQDGALDYRGKPAIKPGEPT